MRSCTEVREEVPLESLLSGKVPPPQTCPQPGTVETCAARGGHGSASHLWIDVREVIRVLLSQVLREETSGSYGMERAWTPESPREVACHLQHLSWILDCVRNLTSPSLKFFVLLK